MSDFLKLSEGLNYVEKPEGEVTTYTLDLDKLPKYNYSLIQVYDFCEDFIETIDQTQKIVDIIVCTSEKSKKDAMFLFCSFMSILSKKLTSNDLKEGEKRFAPRTAIMDNTDLDVITMKRFLNYKSNGIEFLKVRLIRKGKSLMAL